MMSALENANPLVVGKLKERIITPQEEDDSIRDEIDAREIFGIPMSTLCCVLFVIGTPFCRILDLLEECRTLWGEPDRVFVCLL